MSLVTKVIQFIKFELRSSIIRTSETRMLTHKRENHRALGAHTGERAYELADKYNEHGTVLPVSRQDNSLGFN
jgi:hypothetical protein